MAEIGFKSNIKVLEVLSSSEIQKIKDGIESVLINTGVTVESEDAIDFLEQHGCTSDRSNKRVRFTSNIINDALNNFPETFDVAARDEDNNWHYDKNNMFTYLMSSNGKSTFDVGKWIHREPTRKEFYDYMKVLEFLPNCHGIQSYPWFGFEKVPQVMRMLEDVAAKIRMTTKVTTEGSVLGNDKWTRAMCDVVGMDLIMLVNPVAPLILNSDTTDKITRFTGNDIPYTVNSGPLGGAASPATIAGSMTSCGAEHMAAIVYSQLIKPGSRFFTNYASMLQNMTTGAPFFAQVGNMLHDAANTQLWRSYGIPVVTVSPSWTNSKKIDIQAGYETAMAAVLSTLSGAMVLKFLGGMTGQLSAHPIKAIIDNDVAGMIIRFMQGIEVTDETIALDIIDQVGPLPGQFLNTRHTRKWWRKEQYLPDVADITSVTGWMKNEEKSILENAQEKYEYIINEFEPKKLSEQQENAIENILNDARQYYRKQGLISDDEWTLYQEDLKSKNYPYA